MFYSHESELCDWRFSLSNSGFKCQRELISNSMRKSSHRTNMVSRQSGMRNLWLLTHGFPLYGSLSCLHCGYRTHVRLVATLGAKSALKKVNRKDILNVNVPKACNTIVAPDAPMALRLQSNLLWDNFLLPLLSGYIVVVSFLCFTSSYKFLSKTIGTSIGTVYRGCTRSNADMSSQMRNMRITRCVRFWR